MRGLNQTFATMTTHHLGEFKLDIVLNVAGGTKSITGKELPPWDSLYFAKLATRLVECVSNYGTCFLTFIICLMLAFVIY